MIESSSALVMPRRTGATPLANAAILLARLLLCRCTGGSPASEPAADTSPLLLEAWRGPRPCCLASGLLLLAAPMRGELLPELLSPLGGLLLLGASGCSGTTSVV